MLLADPYALKKSRTPSKNRVWNFFGTSAHFTGDVSSKTQCLQWEKSESTTTTASEHSWFALYEAYGTRPYEWGEDPDRQKANTKEEETDLGLLNEGMRYRDLETGTFLTRDPIGYGDGPNMYCYVHCNPITHFDAFGLWEDKATTALGFLDEAIDVATFMAGSWKGSMSYANGIEMSVDRIGRASGLKGAEEKKWATIELQLLTEAVNQLATDRNAQSLTLSATKAFLQNKVDGQYNKGKTFGRLGTGGLITAMLGAEIGAPLGIAALVGDGSNLIRESVENYIRSTLDSGEIGDISYETNLSEFLTPEMLDTFLESDAGQELISSLLELAATGEVHIEIDLPEQEEVEPDIPEPDIPDPDTPDVDDN